jgi:acyl-CoA synthetase (AMP-forming)/AMP-acid ligase II
MIPYFLREPVEDNSVSTCRLFTFCGEPLMKIDADRLAERYPYARIINTYGPTEATLFCSFYEYERGEIADNGEVSLPVGQPIPSWNFVLVPEDGDLRLILLSDNISTGYAGMQSPQFATVELFGRQMRALDTGDYFRMAGPHLYFSHRKDAMVKVRGNRIDLGEIEAAAKRSGLVNPVAMVIDNAIAIVAEGNAGAAIDIMTELARYLPRTNLPAQIKFLPSHPRTVNGKLDRGAIREAFGDLP